jgi:hypothetical protein
MVAKEINPIDSPDHINTNDNKINIDNKNPNKTTPAPKLDSPVNPIPVPKLAPAVIGITVPPVVSAPVQYITRPLLKESIGYEVNCHSKDILPNSLVNRNTLIFGTIRHVDLLRNKIGVRFDINDERGVQGSGTEDLEFDYESSLINWLVKPKDSLLTRSKVNALNCCVHYLCLTGWAYVFYVGHIDKVMKLFSML